MKKFFTILLSVSLFSAGTCAAAIYNVMEFGAKGDGKNIDSDAINAAIDRAAATGGGTVYLPAGTYNCFSIRLKSNIHLYLDQGCTIKAATASAERGYDPAEENPHNAYQDFGHSHWQNSLIWGIGLNNVSITGFGLIDGTGSLLRGQNRAGEVATANKAIALKECRNVNLKDFSVLMGGHFALLATGVDNLTIDNLRVDTNRDALDIDCCANVRISNCLINSQNDDGIVLKSSFALGYAKAAENVTITNCQVSGYDPGTMLDGTFRREIKTAPDRNGPTGRIKFGTESNGGFKNIAISNCVFDHCRGLALETVDGGTIEDITITNISMRGINNPPIFIRLGNRARGPAESTPVAVVRRIKISNITVKDADNAQPILIAGIPGHPVEDVTLSNIQIQYKGGFTMEDAANQPESMINNFFTRTEPTTARNPYDVPEREKDYPEPAVFGVLPAAAMFVRHARNIEIRDVKVGYAEKDTRPGVVIMDVDGISFDNFRITNAAPGVPAFVLSGVKDFSTSNSGVKDMKTSASGHLEIK